MTSPISDLEQRLAEARATAFREGLEEAAKIADEEAGQANKGKTRFDHGRWAAATRLGDAFRSRAASLPGGETT